MNIRSASRRISGGDDWARVHETQCHYTGNLSGWQSHSSVWCQYKDRAEMMGYTTGIWRASWYNDKFPLSVYPSIQFYTSFMPIHSGIHFSFQMLLHSVTHVFAQSDVEVSLSALDHGGVVKITPKNWPDPLTVQPWNLCTHTHTHTHTRLRTLSCQLP